MATRDIPGAICFKVSRILPKTENSIVANPVTLPPGRARFLIYPDSTTEAVPGMMIGTVRVSCIRTGMTRPPRATMTSGFDSTRLAALARTRSILSVVQRSSNSMLAPRVHPSLCSSCRNAPTRDCHSVSLGGNGNRIPMRRIRSACCARAASGCHVPAAPPTSVMNSRRLIGLLQAGPRFAP
jgi:hypothetical protein